MAAGAPIVASNLDAFARVLDDGALGELAVVGDAASLASKVSRLLSSPARRDELRMAARHAVARYDWSVVAGEVMRVYEMAIAASTGRVVEAPEPVDVTTLERNLPAL
jgi:phosphatidyl-myo-inositol alpha-mannosyltransferase